MRLDHPLSVYIVKALHLCESSVANPGWGGGGGALKTAAKKVKALISAAPVLARFDRNKPLVVQADASKDGLGAVLMQEGHSIAYASRGPVSC